MPIELQESTEEVLTALKKELQEYLRKALQLSGKRACDVDKHLGTNGMAGHYFGKSQWEFPTPEAYIKLKEILPLDREYPWHLLFLQSLQSLQRLQRLQRLESLQRLELYCDSYENIRIPDNSVIYADIPYEGTDCGSYDGFNHKEFYDWAARQKNIYISSYEIKDPRFICVYGIPKRKNSAPGGYGKKIIERIYTVRNRD